MKIKSFGCSFIFGTDLSDNPESSILLNPVGKFSRLTWPALLAKEKGYDYECFARPGSGNLQITERTLNQIALDTQSFYIIAWSWIDRFDFIKSTDMWQPWGTLMPDSQLDIEEIYFKHLQSEYRDKLSSLIYAKTVIDTLLQKQVKFIMTCQDSLMLDQQWHTSEAVKDLQNYVAPFMTWFEGKTFLDWSRNNGFPESANWHPLEQAHRSAADYMLTVFDKQKTSDPVPQVLV